MAKFVAYFRVSTAQQGASGLGLDAQKAAVEDYVDRVDGEIVARFQEVDSGSKAGRPELERALKYCRLSKSMLVVAKLDRLARNVQFIAQLMESGVDFIAADMPHANKLTLHIVAAMAEYERQVISERTSSALQRLKKSGKKLGNPRFPVAQLKGLLAAKENADTFARAMIKVMKFHDPEGKLSATRLADLLNAESVRGRRGGRWSAAAIISLRKRIANLSARANSIKS